MVGALSEGVRGAHPGVTTGKSSAKDKHDRDDIKVVEPSQRYNGQKNHVHPKKKPSGLQGQVGGG